MNNKREQVGIYACSALPSLQFVSGLLRDV